MSNTLPLRGQGEHHYWGDCLYPSRVEWKQDEKSHFFSSLNLHKIQYYVITGNFFYKRYISSMILPEKEKWTKEVIQAMCLTLNHDDRVYHLIE
jgi:hypothetical protein